MPGDLKKGWRLAPPPAWNRVKGSEERISVFAIKLVENGNKMMKLVPSQSASLKHGGNKVMVLSENFFTLFFSSCISSTTSLTVLPVPKISNRTVAHTHSLRHISLRNTSRNFLWNKWSSKIALALLGHLLTLSTNQCWKLLQWDATTLLSSAYQILQKF